MTQAIYVDANATYPVEPEHYDRVSATLKEVDGNPSSIHASGRRAKVALEDARASVAAMLGAKAPEIVFTSGATEGNNLVLQGLCCIRVQKGQVPHVIVSAVEHSSVIEPAKLLADRGHCTLTLAPVDREGRVDAEALAAAVRPETALVAVMHANNEVGTINPVGEVAALVKAKNKDAHVHVDAVQTLGKLDLAWMGGSPIDSVALSAHKVGGFKGVGALYLKGGTKLAILIAGGGQERGRRAGTENMPGIVSFGLRCEELKGGEAARVKAMLAARNAWIQALKGIPGAAVHGAAATDPTGAKSLANTVNCHVAGVAGDDILLNFDLAGIQASSGSACASGTARPSRVLVSMGYDDDVALNSIRVSFCHKSTLAEVERMRAVLQETVVRVLGA